MASTRRTVLAAGAAVAATAAVPRVFAQRSGIRGTGKFYERGPVRIYYEETGSGFPLLLLPGGGLNSTISFFTGNSPFNAIEEFQGEYRCITADLLIVPFCRMHKKGDDRLTSDDARFCRAIKSTEPANWFGRWCAGASVPRFRLQFLPARVIDGRDRSPVQEKANEQRHNRERYAGARCRIAES
jgi:hypothetical protein